MKIAQVAPLYEAVPPLLYGGMERVIYYLTEELVKERHKVTLFASGDSVTNAALGLTRTYYLKDGKDVTDWISDENSFACSIINFITRKPDRRTIELLEPSILFALHYNYLENLSSKHHDIENLFRKLVSFGLVQLQQKFDDLHFSSALQRYQTLTLSNINDHPAHIYSACSAWNDRFLSWHYPGNIEQNSRPDLIFDNYQKKLFKVLRPL